MENTVNTEVSTVEVPVESVTLTFNTVKLAKRGKGVKDEFYTANLLGKQVIENRLTRKGENVEEREVTYDHITPEQASLILEQINAIEGKHIILAKALDSYLAEKAREASNPVQSLAGLILEEGILTKDADKSRQIAQAMMMQAKTQGLDVADIYESMCLLVERKAAKEKEALEKAKAV